MNLSIITHTLIVHSLLFFMHNMTYTLSSYSCLSIFYTANYSSTFYTQNITLSFGAL